MGKAVSFIYSLYVYICKPSVAYRLFGIPAKVKMDPYKVYRIGRFVYCLEFI